VIFCPKQLVFQDSMLSKRAFLAYLIFRYLHYAASWKICCKIQIFIFS